MKTLGVLSGMGPGTAVLFLDTMLSLNTSARCDHDHPKTIIYSNTEIPSRVNALLHGGPCPIESIVKSLNQLQQMGADVGIILCNTAHAFFDQVAVQTSLPLINIVENTAQYIMGHPDISKQQRLFLMATEGTAASRLYPNALHPIGYQLITPDQPQQAVINDVIFHREHGVKSTANTLSDTASDWLKQTIQEQQKISQNTLFIAGCTEISIALKALGIEFIDPLEALAKTCLESLEIV